MNRYASIILHLFKRGYSKGVTEILFTRDQIFRAARALKIELPKNLGDIVYSFRYRVAFPEYMQKKAPSGKRWIIQPKGSGRYAFVLTGAKPIAPSPNLIVTKLPDATPGIISMYALSDEQALLAVIRYNRLLDVFTGAVCYSLQSHLRSHVPEMGQVETDEVYVGVDRSGVQYVFPVQAKGGKDKIEVVQIEQDLRLCQQKFSRLLARPIAAKFLVGGAIAMFELCETDAGIEVMREKHYQLVPPDDLSDADLASYRKEPGSAD